LAFRRGEQPLQQGERAAGKMLREQDTGEHEILPLPGVHRLVVRAQAPLFCPADGRSHVALGQQQPRSVRRNGVGQVGHGRARAGPLGLNDRFAGAGCVTLSLADPRQRGKTGGQRLGFAELPAPRDAVGDVAEGSLKLVPLVFHLRHAHVPDASDRERRPTGQRGDLKHFVVGGERGVQSPLGALNLAEEVAAPRGQATLTGCPPSGVKGRSSRSPPAGPGLCLCCSAG
jgi:hypothetical protein